MKNLVNLNRLVRINLLQSINKNLCKFIIIRLKNFNN